MNKLHECGQSDPCHGKELDNLGCIIKHRTLCNSDICIHI